MPNLATWIRRKDAKWFRPIFGKHPEIKVWNALNRKVPLEKMDGLLLTGGSDISPEFLRQKVVDPSLLSKDMDPERDRWEFEAAQEALSRGLRATRSRHSTTAPFTPRITPLFKSEQRASPGDRTAGRRFGS